MYKANVDTLRYYFETCHIGSGTCRVKRDRAPHTRELSLGDHVSKALECLHLRRLGLLTLAMIHYRRINPVFRLYYRRINPVFRLHYFNGLNKTYHSFLEHLIDTKSSEKKVLQTSTKGRGRYKIGYKNL